MSNKIALFRAILKNTEHGITKLQIIQLQGVFKVLLVEKIQENGSVSKIKVKCLMNDNPYYEENQLLTVNLNDGGLIEIQIID
tara:strand:- start:1621 stop:1869 length:249 start_codon:yes stop_codon:yes gene_type:complete